MFIEDDDLVAALNLYSTKLEAFDFYDQMLALMLSTHVSLALTSAGLREKNANLTQALSSNRSIGAAIGVLMSQYKLTQEQAFDLLRVASQHTHRKLADIARDVAETGTRNLPAFER